VNSETILEMMLKTHFDIVNLALELTAQDGRHFMIAGGKSARAGELEEGIDSEPDRASFLAPISGQEPNLVYCFDKLDSKGSKHLRSKIPGEIKLWYKFRLEFLDAMRASKHIKSENRVETPDHYKRAQAEQVFTQIYQYMNERHSAIGYLITDRELICVRRIPEDRLGLRYGVIDVSPSIPLSAPEGQLNAKLALWYLHHRYAVKEPNLSEFRRTPKPRTWSRAVQAIIDARSAVDNRVGGYELPNAVAEGVGGYGLRSKVGKARVNANNGGRGK